MAQESVSKMYHGTERIPEYEPNITYREQTEQNDAEKPEHEDQPLDGNRQIVATHYNSLKEIGRSKRTQSRIYYMRNFNNWIKSILINDYIQLIRGSKRQGDKLFALDMCCGKGGDLLKWSKGNITHLICTDIAEVSVEQCKIRYENMKKTTSNDRFTPLFSAEFFACDATLVRLRERYRDPSMKLNLVSCQFAFHYSFESLSQADCMVRNAAECLEEGGYFIATMPDAYEIMHRLRKSENGRSFGNSIYNIEFLCETNPPPLFGAKYQFHLEEVVDCPEFLVYFPLLEKLCRKYGLKLERRVTFADYYRENAQKGAELLERMHCLQTVHPESLSPNDPEYAHIFDAAKSSHETGPLNTLSKSEWEAITLYLVCAFRKCKNTLDAEGNPIFEFEDDNENANKCRRKF